MAYIEYNDLKTPNDVLEKIAEYVKSKSYNVVEDIKDDFDIYDMTRIDGKKFVFKDKTDSYFINLRSANGFNIFGDTNSSFQDTVSASANENKGYRGLGLTISEGYSKTQRWYSQYRVPVQYRTTTVLGAYMPVPSGIENIPAVEKPEVVEEPKVVEKPTQPDLPSKPIAPTHPVDGSLNIPEPIDPTNSTISNMKLFNYADVPGDGIPTQGYPCFIYDNNILHKYSNDYVVIYDFSYKGYGVDGQIPVGSGGERFYKGNYQWPDSIPAGTIANLATAHRYGVTGCWLGPTWIKTSDNHGSSPYAVMTNEAWNFFINYQSIVDAYKNKTSQAWQDYNAQVANALAIYNAKVSQYNIDLAQYNTDMNTYNAQVAELIAAYNTAIDNYNAYLAALALYNHYLELLATYNAYLALISTREYKYTLFCNEVLSADATRSTLTFSLLKQSSKYMQVSHLLLGNINKYDEWGGGVFFSGSACRETMLNSIKLYEDKDLSDSVIDPVLSNSTHANTFLRINIDDAPSDARGNIYWASSGTGSTTTGKPLALPIRVGNTGNGEIPHYYFLQSKDRLDPGRNVNTLNCITINLPIYMAVRVDPDTLNNYAAVGAVLGVYFISTLNVQTGSTYEINYPASNDRCQAFSVGKRRGAYGFDGISIKQTDEE